MTVFRRACLAAVAATVFAAWLVARAQSPSPAKEAATGPVTTGFKPLDYFQNQCARCHGDYGSAYGSEFGRNITDQQLRDFVRDMAEGPAQAPLGDADLAVETGFHRALRDGRPFAVVVAWKDGVLSGEAMPGSKITLELGGKALDVPLDGNAWKIAAPAGASWQAARLRVQKDKKETVIPLAAHAY